MGGISRRKMLAAMGLGALSAGIPAAWGKDAVETTSGTKEHSHESLPLSEYQPRPMLHVKESHVSRASYPVIDFHTHLTQSAHSVNGVSLGEARIYNGTPQELLPVMEHANLLALVNLTGGFGSGLRDSIARCDHSHPGRFYSFTEPSYNLFQQADYPRVAGGSDCPGAS